MGISSGAPEKILLYSHDSFGLGHIRRTLTIAKRLSLLGPGVSQLYVTGSPQPEFFETPERFDYVKIPTVTKDAAGAYISKDLPVSLPEVVRIRSMAIQSVLRSFDPDAILVDHTPRGLGGELESGLRDYRERRPDGRLILGWRDIIDSPHRTRRQLQSERSVELIDELYDEIMVYGHRHVMDVGDEYDLPASLRDRLHYLGIVCPYCDDCSDPGCRVPTARPQERRSIVVCAGGGADGFPLLRAAVAALAPVAEAQSLSVTMVSGPFMDQSRVSELRRAIGDVSNFEFVQGARDMLRRLVQADLVLSMGGYNSVYESLCLGKRLLVHPRCHPRLEQHERASRLENLGLAEVLTEAELDEPLLLLNRVLDLIDRDPPDARLAGIQFSGACRAARRVLGQDDPLAEPITDEALRSGVDSTIPTSRSATR